METRIHEQRVWVPLKDARQLECELAETEEDRLRYKGLFHEQERENDRIEAELNKLKAENAELKLKYQGLCQVEAGLRAALARWSEAPNDSANDQAFEALNQSKA